MWLVVSRKIPEDDWNLHALLKVMEDKIEARERVGASLPKSSEKGLATATSLVVERNSKTPNCCYCQQAHFSSSCKKSLTLISVSKF